MFHFLKKVVKKTTKNKQSSHPSNENPHPPYISPLLHLGRDAKGP